MYFQRLSITLRTSSRRTVSSSPHTFRFPFPPPYRLASSVATADLPKAPPHDKVPFSAPPKDETKGELGQVHLPDMSEKLIDHKMSIPSEPDHYQTPTHDTSSTDFPSLRQQSQKLHTVASPSTLPGGGPSHAASSADDTFEGFKDDHKLPASAAESEKVTKDGESGNGEGDKEHKERKEQSENENENSGNGKGGGRPLNQEERMGLIKGVVFVVGSYVLSGLTRPYKPQHPHQDKLQVDI